MAEWTRSTPWRQGDLLSHEAYQALFPTSDDRDAVGIVISHSCDLAQDPAFEPDVEVILAKKLEKIDGNCAHAKTARRLHLSMTKGDSELLIELSATAKSAVAKSSLADWDPDAQYKLSGDELSILQRWLAARYRRSTFPDEFDRRLGDSGIPKKLTKIIEPLGDLIIALFFDVDGGEEIARGEPDDPYLLSILLLYTDQKDEGALDKVAEAAEKISELFKSKFFNSSAKSWKTIELDGCDCVSVHALTYAQSLALKKWSGDHISLRSDPHQPMQED